MLTPEQYAGLAKQSARLYTELELEIIEQIAIRIANVGYANTVVLNNIRIAQEMGLIYRDVINLVAKYNNQTYEEIKRIFEEAGAKTIAFDDKIYKAEGLNPVPMRKSRSMMQLLSATIEKTSSNLYNLAMTTANSSQTAFYNAINKAYMEVNSGVKSYSQAILDTINDVSKESTIVTYPSGYKMSLEAATRMNIVTSVSQSCGKLQELRADEMGCDLMELTAHAGARPTHAQWQGQIVSRSGQAGYLSLEDIGYGAVTGFKGANCRHDWYPYYEGSARTYTKEMLEEYENAKVVYNGKEMSLYDVQQLQRKMERQIRNDKKEIAGLQGVLTSNNKDAKLIEQTKAQLLNKQNKLNQDNLILNEFIKQTKSRKDYSRLVVGKASTNLQNSDKIVQNKNDEVNAVQYIGKLDRSKIGEYAKRIVTADVVLTDERKRHILEDHEKDYEVIMKNIERVVLSPNEVLEDLKNKDTLFFIDKLDKNNLNVVVKLNTTNNKKHPKNSVMTAWIIRDKNLNKLRERNKSIYKKE